MTELLIGLILTMLSGLSFLAYRHPFGFKKIANVLHNMSIIVFIAVISWTLGVQSLFARLIPYLPRDDEKYKAAQQVGDSLEVSIPIVFGVFLAIQLYIFVMTNLHKIIEETPNRDDEL